MRRTATCPPCRQGSWRRSASSVSAGPDDLAVALRTSGFVDADWRLHDWGDYTGRLIDQRAASRERQRRRRARLRAAAMEESKEDGT